MIYYIKKGDIILHKFFFSWIRIGKKRTRKSCSCVQWKRKLEKWKLNHYWKSNFRTFRSSRPELFCKKSVLKNFVKFTGKYLRQSLFFDKVGGLSPATLLKKGLWHKRFPVNFAKFLRTPFKELKKLQDFARLNMHGQLKAENFFFIKKKFLSTSKKWPERVAITMNENLSLTLYIAMTLRSKRLKITFSLFW